MLFLLHAEVTKYVTFNWQVLLAKLGVQSVSVVTVSVFSFSLNLEMSHVVCKSE
jgi:hypothetical protein